MSEWGVVGVIASLLGLITAVIVPVIRLNTSITKLSVILDNLTAKQASDEEDNHKAHVRLWNHNEKQDDMLDKHDRSIENHHTRISALEGRKNV